MMTENIEVDFVTGLKDGTSFPSQSKSYDTSSMAEARSEEKRQKFAKEIIEFTLIEDDDDKEGKFIIRSDCSWKVQRFRLTPDFLHRLINRLPDKAGCTVAYLKRVENGDIVAPEEIRRLCQPHPSSYHMILYTPTKTKDVLQDDNHYQGKMKFIIRSVPQYSQNGSYQVQAEDVRNWITGGILSDDLTVIKLENRIKNNRKVINQIENRIRKIAVEDVFDKSGHVLIGKKADDGRDVKFNKLSREKDACRVEYEKFMHSLENLRKGRLEELDIVVSNEHVDEVYQRNTWSGTFFGTKKDYYEKLVIKKSNWRTCLMFAGVPTMVNGDRIQINSIPNEKSNERDQYIVNTGGITVERVEHGIGFFHKTASDLTETWRNYNFHVDFYHGTYKEGIKSGHGMIYNSSGIYGGHLKNNLPCGEGLMVFKDGDIIKGKFDVNTYCPKSHLTNPYARGLPHGKTAITFSDGAIYEGEMKQGQITGHGVYIGATGEKREGEFEKGLLVSGKIVNTNGDVMEGIFRNGVLNGDGIQISKGKRSVYRGHFVDGEIHGKGETVYKNRDASIINKYTGFFLNGSRTGAGRLDYFDSGFDDNNKIIRLRIDGPWLAGQPKAGGKITKVGSYTSVPTTNKPLSKYRWLYKLKNIEEKKGEVHHEKQVRDFTLSSQFRGRIEKRKKIIFDTHRNYLVKILMKKGRRIDQTEWNQHDENSLKLPSKAKYYTHQKMCRGPTSLKEAQEKPGLRSCMCAPNKTDKIFNNIIRSIQSEWLKAGLTLEDAVIINHIHNEYDSVEEKWAMINVDQMHTEIYRKYSTTS